MRIGGREENQEFWFWDTFGTFQWRRPWNLGACKSELSKHVRVGDVHLRVINCKWCVKPWSLWNYLGVRIVEREDKGADKKPWGGPILRSQTRRLLRALRLRSGSKEENRRLCCYTDKGKRIPSRGGLSSCEMGPYWNLGAYSNVTEMNCIIVYQIWTHKSDCDLDQRNVKSHKMPWVSPCCLSSLLWLAIRLIKKRHLIAFPQAHSTVLCSPLQQIFV